MFANPELAARIDRAEGRLCAAIAENVRAAGGASSPPEDVAVVEVGGGLAVFAGADSPTNKMIGAGFDGSPPDADLERVERAFAERRAPLQAELATLAAPEFHATLVRRGYAPSGFENVLGRTLAAHDAGVPAGIEVRVFPAEERERWTDALVEAFAAPDAGGVGGDAIPPSDTLRKWSSLTSRVPGFECVEARVDGQLAGAAAWRIDGDIAQLCGAGTLPVFRRRGVQTALLRWRLARAAGLGCRVAVVTTQPASKSQQNVQREGFALLYARQLLVRSPA